MLNILRLGLLVAVPLAISHSEQDCAGQYVEATTEVEFFCHPFGSTHTYLVHSVVGTNQWFLEGNFLSNAKASFWFTGSNIVESTVITESLDAETTRKLSRPGMIAATSPEPGQEFTRVYESNDGNPGRPVRVVDLLVSSAARTVWLALCSGSCLRQQHSQLYPPSDLWKEFVSGTHFNVNKTLYEDTLSLPANIIYYADEHQPLFQYGANTVTNVGGWTVPLSFHLIQYCPTGTKGWMLDFLARGKVTSVKEIATFPKLSLAPKN